MHYEKRKKKKTNRKSSLNNISKNGEDFDSLFIVLKRKTFFFVNISNI